MTTRMIRPAQARDSALNPSGFSDLAGPFDLADPAGLADLAGPFGPYDLVSLADFAAAAAGTQATPEEPGQC